ncbi:MAG: YegP family protein [Rhizobiaceae bacterium]|nr:YegP family protein [Rhizobiaceae bacterium]
MFEIFKAKTGGYFWHLKGNNGEILCHSEVLTTKQSAHDGIAAVKRIAPTAQVYDRT